MLALIIRTSGRGNNSLKSETENQSISMVGKFHKTFTQFTNLVYLLTADAKWQLQNFESGI